LQEPHVVIFKKTAFIIVTTVKTTNLKYELIIIITQLSIFPQYAVVNVDVSLTTSFLRSEAFTVKNLHPQNKDISEINVIFSLSFLVRRASILSVC
jgi:hypothetical protein